MSPCYQQCSPNSSWDWSSNTWVCVGTAGVPSDWALSCGSVCVASRLLVRLTQCSAFARVPPAALESVHLGYSRRRGSAPLHGSTCVAGAWLGRHNGRLWQCPFAWRSANGCPLGATWLAKQKQRLWSSSSVPGVHRFCASGRRQQQQHSCKAPVYSLCKG